MAPSVNSPLHPIVIPEIAVAPHFTCLGSGLLQNGHLRESPTALGALLLPSAATPRGIPNSSKPKNWWRAQCLHYGIDMPVSATIERMRARLEEGLRVSGGLVVPGDLLDLEHKKCGEFRKLNAQVRDKVSGGESATGKAKAKPKPKPKSEPKEVITTTTITTTTTTKSGNTATASRGGSGAGAAKVAKAAKAAKAGSGSGSAPMKTSGVSKPKPVAKPKVKKEVKEEEDGLYNYPHPSREETLRQQREFLKTTNYTSPHGPLPSYLRQNQQRPSWQTQAAPTPEPELPRPTVSYGRYSGPPRGGGNAGSSSRRPRLVPQGDGTFKKLSAQVGGGYRSGGGGSISSTHQRHAPQPHQGRREFVEEEAPPPAYGSWLQGDSDGMGDSSSGYSGGADGGQTTTGNRSRNRREYKEEEEGDSDGDSNDSGDYGGSELGEGYGDETQAEVDPDSVMEDWEAYEDPDSENELSDTTLVSYHSEVPEPRNRHQAMSEDQGDESEEDEEREDEEREDEEREDEEREDEEREDEEREDEEREDEGREDYSSDSGDSGSSSGLSVWNTAATVQMVE